jgi:hypothetical protein
VWSGLIGEPGNQSFEFLRSTELKKPRAMGRGAAHAAGDHAAPVRAESDISGVAQKKMKVDRVHLCAS